jgi:hypothetical protein
MIPFRDVITPRVRDADVRRRAERTRQIEEAREDADDDAGSREAFASRLARLTSRARPA